MGNQNLEPLDRMNNLDSSLNEYELSLGLPKYVERALSEEVTDYLSMSRERMEKLSIEDSAEIAVMLGSLSFHIQRAYNREIARTSWASAHLKDKVCGRETQYGGSWDSQFIQAANGDDYTKKVLALKNYAQQRADRLHFLATSLKSVSDLYINLQRAKATRQ